MVQLHALWGRREIVSAGAIPGAELQRHRTQPRLLVQVDSRTSGVNRNRRSGRLGYCADAHQDLRALRRAVFPYRRHAIRQSGPHVIPQAPVHRNECLNDLILPLTKRTQHAAACAPRAATRPNRLPTRVPLRNEPNTQKPGPNAPPRQPAARSPERIGRTNPTRRRTQLESVTYDLEIQPARNVQKWTILS
jgi:hypothetical protein